MMYKEEELLKLYKDNVFLYEEIAANKNNKVRFCTNSIPCFCRIDNRTGGHFLWLEFAIRSMQRDNTDYYNRNLPKCGWGIYAFLAAHGYVDDEFGLRYRDDAGNMIKRNALFGLYFNRQKTLYEEANKRRYIYYKVDENYSDIEELDNAFFVEHIASEKVCISRTEELADKNVDVICFGGRLKPVVQDYLSWVEEKQVERMAFQRTKRIVANQIGKPKVCVDTKTILSKRPYNISVLTFLFGNDENRAKLFLSELQGLTASEIGRIIKRTDKIDINGFGTNKVTLLKFASWLTCETNNNTSFYKMFHSGYSETTKVRK